MVTKPKAHPLDGVIVRADVVGDKSRYTISRIVAMLTPTLALAQRIAVGQRETSMHIIDITALANQPETELFGSLAAMELLYAPCNCDDEPHQRPN
jgi:hypothetical protein